MNALTARMVSERFSSVLLGPDLTVTTPAPLAESGAGQLTFVGDTERYADALNAALSKEAIVLAPIGTLRPEDATGTVIPVENPRAAFGQLLADFFAPKAEAGLSPTARVHASAEIHPTAHVGEYSVIREGVTVGEYAEIRDHVVVGRNVSIGAHSLIKSHAVIGEEGFGIETDAAGNNFHVPHIGSVQLGEYVEVGNFTTVCSGTLSPTRVGDYTKIDDHVHVAHNCQIGRNVIITACAEVSGSVVLEDNVWIGPNASIIQGLTLGKDALLGIGAVAVKSIPANEVRVGNPARRLGDNKK